MLREAPNMNGTSTALVLGKVNHFFLINLGVVALY